MIVIIFCFFFYLFSFFFFFFFQAEDGIRDADVTGVQTCALPISPSPLATDPRPGRAGTPPTPPCSSGARGHRTSAPPDRARRRHAPTSRRSCEIGRASCRERV